MVVGWNGIRSIFELNFIDVVLAGVSVGVSDVEIGDLLRENVDVVFHLFDSFIDVNGDIRAIQMIVSVPIVVTYHMRLQEITTLLRGVVNSVVVEIKSRDIDLIGRSRKVVLNIIENHSEWT